MTNLASPAARLPVRLMIMGPPKSAKTGGLACLANAGFKLRILDYDGNLDPLFTFCTPAGLANIDAVTLKDRKHQKGNKLVLKGRPSAFERGFELVEHWKYKDADGNTVDLGSADEWGYDTILVVDSGTNMGWAAMDRVMFLGDRIGKRRRFQDWGSAQEEQDVFCDIITSPPLNCHVIVNFHIKLIGPDMVEEDDDDTNKGAKQQQHQLIPHRLYPSALGKALPPEIHRHFPYLLRAETASQGKGKSQRVFSLVPRPEIDTGVPLKGLPDTLPIKDGLLTLFAAAGFQPPKKEKLP